MSMEYDVVTHCDLTKLTEIVNEKIKVGYKPIGGICLSRTKFSVQIPGTSLYSQAIIKEK